MEHVTKLRCVICHGEYSPATVPYTCPACGVDGILDVEYDYAAVARAMTAPVLKQRPLSHWRYEELLPIERSLPLPPLQVGWTPVYETPRLARHIGLRSLYLKDDGRNPTASFKDRASSVGVVKAMAQSATAIACASTGNAASSLAGFSASVGLESFIFVPEMAPEPKVTQLLVFGANVFRVQGTYRVAYDLCQEACARFGWYNRNCAINPYLVEGKKTVGLEIAEQMGDLLPDWVVLSVGDGCTIAGAYKGLLEMKKIGLATRVPRMLGVQAEGARPIVDAFSSNTDLVPVETTTCADSISVGMPRNWRKAVRAVRQSGGSMVAVSDAEIRAAMLDTARLAAVFAEPAAAAAMAGLRRAVATGVVGAGESALVVITGSGLKDIKTALETTAPARLIPPSLSALEKILLGS
ncbi:MAG: threonine synthase [Acidobacteria bacterium]|nr:threonine synthase [Acidobacteriota bacterium]MBI3656931.1 threonine synthase [Acidobacteriota bacterium]